jgi:hypothetical protein
MPYIALMHAGNTPSEHLSIWKFLGICAAGLKPKVVAPLDGQVLSRFSALAWRRTFWLLASPTPGVMKSMCSFMLKGISYLALISFVCRRGLS